MIYSFKTKPYKHQVDALKKILPLKRGGGLFMDMGTGKTKVAIDYANIKEMKGEIDRVLVLGPLSTLGVWDSEIRKHSASETLKWRVTNYDKARIPHYLSQLRLYLKDGRALLILDEGHKLKNPSSKQSKAAYLLSKLAECVLVLTGTPITKHPLDLFGEMRVIDDSILGSSFNVFKKQYAMWGGYGGYQLIKLVNLKGLMRRVAPRIFQAKKDDCLDLPKRTHEIVPVDLEKSRHIYDKMAREAIIAFEGEDEDTNVEAPIILTQLLRLSQITGGWVKQVDDNYRNVGTEKRDALSRLLEEFVEQDRTKVVIFVRFLKELKDAAEVAKQHGYKVLPFYGAVRPAVRDQRLAEFEENEQPTAFIAQISTGSLGISLTAASEAIFYSHTYNYAEFAQACDRLHRIGQRHAVTYYHLIARDTVDEAVWLSLKTKRNIAELVLQRPELLTSGDIDA